MNTHTSAVLAHRPNTSGENLQPWEKVSQGDPFCGRHKVGELGSDTDSLQGKGHNPGGRREYQPLLNA